MLVTCKCTQESIRKSQASVLSRPSPRDGPVLAVLNFSVGLQGCKGVCTNSSINAFPRALREIAALMQAHIARAMC